MEKKEEKERSENTENKRRERRGRVLGASHGGEIRHGKGGDVVKGDVQLEALALALAVEAEGKGVVRLGGQLGVPDLPDDGRVLVPLIGVLVKEPRWGRR